MQKEQNKKNLSRQDFNDSDVNLPYFIPFFSLVGMNVKSVGKKIFTKFK